LDVIAEGLARVIVIGGVAGAPRNPNQIAGIHTNHDSQSAVTVDEARVQSQSRTGTCAHSLRTGSAVKLSP
jgi:hypothetical protein